MQETVKSFSRVTDYIGRVWKEERLGVAREDRPQSGHHRALLKLLQTQAPRPAQPAARTPRTGNGALFLTDSESLP